MKLAWTGLLAVVVALGSVPFDADAKRLGGGRTSGMSRDMPSRSAPDAPAGKPAQSQQAGQQNAAAPGAAAAATPKRNWLGPIAGLAAGLGLAALLSHFGLGEGFASFLMLALLVFGAIFAIRWFMRRNAPQPAGSAAVPRTGLAPGQVSWPNAGGDRAAPAAVADPVMPASQPVAPVAAAATAATAGRVFVPAAFDSEGFARTAKLIFIRLQAANDARDLEDLRRFTTPELFASISLDLQERGAAAQQTEVLNIDAQVLDVANEADRQIVSVRFRGQIREEAGANPVEIDEVWHLVKPHDDSRSWAIAGIEQMA